MADEETQDLTQLQSDRDNTDCIAVLKLDSMDGNESENIGRCRYDYSQSPLISTRNTSLSR